MEPTAIALGANIRACRNKRKMSLNELSRRTGIAASNLSSMELGKSSPTLNTLVKIAAAFNMKAGMLLDEVLYKNVVMCPKGEGENLATDSDTFSIRLLTSEVPLNRMESLIITLKPLSQTTRSVHTACDRFLYCLSGEPRVFVGDEAYVVREGDSLYVSPEVEMQFENPGVGQASVLVVSLTDRGV